MRLSSLPRRFSALVIASILIAPIATAPTATAQPASTPSYEGIVNGDFVTKHFPLKEGETIKYQAFEKKTFPTATVVWGRADRKDEMRVKAGVAPSGSKLMVVFADLKNEKEFERILSTYKDGENVTGVGRRAVWSAKWKQISVLVSPKLAIHVHLDHAGTEDLKATLITLAKDLSKRLR